MARKSKIRSSLANVLQSRYDRFEQAWKHARIDAGNPTSVHDVRIASKRLITAINLADALDSRLSVVRLRRRIGKELKRFSALRDLQIVPERLAPFARDKSVPTLVHRLTAHEARTRDLVVRSMDRRLVKRIKTSTRAVAEDLSRRTGKKDARKLKKYLGKSAESFLKRAATMHADKPKSVRRTRVALKQLRYDLELAAEVLGTHRYDELICSSIELQDSLGAAQDLTVVAEELEAISGHKRKMSVASEMRESAMRAVDSDENLRDFEYALTDQFD